MTKLSDTQAVILSAPAQRGDRNVLPLPGSLRGGAARNVVAALLKRGLIAEEATDSQTKADAAMNRIWRNDEDGRAILLRLTDAGLTAIRIEPEDAAEVGDTAPTVADKAPSVEAPQDAPAETDPAPMARTPRAGTKQEDVIAMLRRKEGATIDEITEALKWRPHTVRGALAGALKKLGLVVSSEKVDGTRIYRIS
jgi:DNA-binding MarR family transcriptional regulator